MALDRRSFLQAGLSGALAIGDPVATPEPQRKPPPQKRALVLTGGVNRGAYQAGVVYGLAEAQGLRDGQPLAYDLVTGASIGALNAYFAATAQYTRLRDAWQDVASHQVFRLKKQFSSAAEPSSGVLNRLNAAVRLALGSTSDVRGVVDPEPIQTLLREFVDPADPVHIPFVYPALNLTRSRVGLFVRRATTPAGLERQAYVDSRPIGSKATPTRIAHDDILRRSIFASAALPVVFDPVRIPRDDGTGFDEYLDGGIADNVPIDIAQKVAAYIDVVAVDPPNDPDAQVQAASALSIVESVFGVMQARINLLATRLAYSEGLAVQNGVSPAAFNYDGYELTISQVRPASTLPGKRFDFSDRAALGEMFEIGRRDGKHGWQKLDPNEVFG